MTVQKLPVTLLHQLTSMHLHIALFSPPLRLGSRLAHDQHVHYIGLVTACAYQGQPTSMHLHGQCLVVRLPVLEKYFSSPRAQGGAWERGTMPACTNIGLVTIMHLHWHDFQALFILYFVPFNTYWKHCDIH